MTGALEGKVAIVTGARRGVGKGVALSLGEAGATVYITGRTVEVGTHPVPGTITETADEVGRLGGHGIAVRVDHRNDDEVDALFGRVRQEQGRLDILVNSAWPTPTGKMPVGVPFWDLPITAWDDIAIVGLRAYIATSGHAARMMIARGDGLIVQISSPTAVRPSSIMFDGICKAAQQRMTEEMARALKRYRVAVVALWPGYVRSEKNMADPDRWPPEMMERFERHGESAQFTGRAVVALATDPRTIEATGKALAVGELAEKYGFTDIDGKRPSPWRELVAALRP